MKNRMGDMEIFLTSLKTNKHLLGAEGPAKAEGLVMDALGASSLRNVGSALLIAK